jgi:hypothetical protein
MTIEVPIPSAELIQQLETATIDTNQTETAAIAAIRERFTEYAKHNGNIQTASYYESHGIHRTDCEAYMMDGGRRVRALRVFDDFGEDGEQGGAMTGYRLYLSERGEWIEVMRSGSWTPFEGQATYWFADIESAETIELTESTIYEQGLGHVRKMTDEEVAKEYNLDAVLTELGKSMAEMTKKLPARHAELRQRAELAARVIAAVGQITH